MKLNVFTEEEAKKATLEYFNGDELASQVWVNKYALKDSDGNLYEKTPSDMHHRLASEIARIENQYPNPLSEQYYTFDITTLEEKSEIISKINKKTG